MPKSISLKSTRTPVDAAPTAAPVQTLTMRMPLPAGRAVAVPNRMTPLERAQLEKAGWSAGKPIPPDFQEIIRVAEQEAQAELEAGPEVLPVDPARPPVELKPVPIESLPPEKQAELRQHMAAAAALTEPDVPEEPRAKRPRTTPAGVNVKPAGARPAPPPAPPPPWSSAPAAEPPAPAPAPAVEPPAEPPAETPGLGGGLALAHCPHCNWDLKMPDIPEPPLEERLAYLQTFLGDKPFVKEYKLLGGRVTVVFRTCHIRELDAIFRQVYREQVNGEIHTYPDYWERANRYRLYLQLQRIRGNGMDIELPAGFSEKTNPNAGTYWEFDEGADQPLKLIEEHMLGQVLQSETINRVLMQKCGEFNRLVSKLEGMSDRPDFIPETAGQP